MMREPDARDGYTRLIRNVTPDPRERELTRNRPRVGSNVSECIPSEAYTDGAGPMRFFQVLEEWRAGGTPEDLELS